MNKHLFFNFGISEIFLVIQSLNPFEKFCLWALMIAINVSVAICQLSIRQFCSFGKRSIGCKMCHLKISEEEERTQSLVLYLLIPLRI